MRNAMQPHRISQAVIHVLFTLVTLSMVLPFLLVVSISFSAEAELISSGYSLLPKVFSMEAYRLVLQAPKAILRAYGVTGTVTVAGTCLGLLLTAMTAYVISRQDFRYNRIGTFIIFFTMLFNGGLVPSYILMTQVLHLKDTLWALILPGMLTPFNIMVMKGFLGKIPGEIVESAKVDGARELTLFFRIILPLATPALATIGLFISFGFWNAWFPAMLYIDNPNLVPLQLMLVRIMDNIEFMTQNEQMLAQMGAAPQDFPALSARMAMVILAAGPMLLVFPFFQRYFVQGLTVGSLKG
ncbi:putative aldouronate transport system permease protein [Paenibacillus sp. UNCCL117]|uniref:carbohydrate ABC transporter permease n=1 Tax=unclassified Paenibacillus TaxID=185978 RepID=UPI00088FF033|nr:MULTISPECIES: carbohydrate ABC transporter permease [unclassified Paenibacillus]SDC93260.1 putative aldouronate transport system permease protein [Paenibacillus sp. cl123]SFW29514.1 putative aldouronate transport system permease protein [Paenibacillus sp. UNCCL117]